jgi:DNA-binding NarL/FixJ family response regulator
MVITGETTTATSSATAIKVAIIEDNHKIREFLEFLLDNTEGLRCAGAFRTMEEALDRIGVDLPDLALVDIGLPGMSGVEGIRLLKERYPKLLLLMNTVYDDDERIFDALCAGASGYLLKKLPPARLLDSIRDAMAGGAPMSPEVARRVIDIFKTIRPPERADYRLTPHEIRLLKLLVDGHSYKSAASELGVKVKTISFYLQRVYEKLQVHSKSEAVAKVLRARIIQ